MSAPPSWPLITVEIDIVVFGLVASSSVISALAEAVPMPPALGEMIVATIVSTCSISMSSITERETVVRPSPLAMEYDICSTKSTPPVAEPE